MAVPLKKYLVIRLSSMGDIVLTTPVFRCLKEQDTGIVIHFLTKIEYAAMLHTNPYIDKIIPLGQDSKKLKRQLQNEHYNLIIDLHKNIRTWRIKYWLSNVPAFSFNKLNIEKWLFVNFKLNLLPPCSVADRYVNTLKSLEVYNDHKGLDFFLDPSIDKNFLTAHNLPNQFIALVIGGAHGTKRLPLDQLLELVAHINSSIVLLGGADERQTAIFLTASNPTKIINLCGQISIMESAYVLSKSMLVITHDTGLMHIAAALKKDIFVIWGSTVQEFGMGPYYEKIMRVKHFQVNNLSCRPCSKIGFNTCPKKHFNCMRQQNIKDIATQANVAIIDKHW
ncbi:MAG: glycosyltransferase family 9 protein [Phycisphaerales bacterium]|nr:glycosyltransferase family 9 protein [Phycisphaerales bacterium]